MKFSALAFKELFKPDEFKEIQKRKSTATGRTTSDVTPLSTEKRGSISTSKAPGSILNTASSHSPTTVPPGSDMPDAQSYKQSTKSVKEKHTDGLHIEMHKNINGFKSYDLLEKQLHDKLFEPDTHSNLQGPAYLDMVHEDMYKTINGKTTLLRTVPTTTVATTEGTRKGGLLPLFSKETTEKKMKKGISCTHAYYKQEFKSQNQVNYTYHYYYADSPHHCIVIYHTANKTNN